MNVKDIVYFRNFNYNLQQNNKKSKKNKNSRNTKSNEKKVHVHIGFNYSGAMAKLATAKTKSQAIAIERSFRCTLKDAIRWESDEHTIRAIKKAIGKAGFKVKALSREERMENMKKVAEGAKNIKEQLKIQDALNKKRGARKRKERSETGDIGDMDDRKYDNSAYSYYDYSSMDIVCDEMDFTDISIAGGMEGENVDVEV